MSKQLKYGLSAVNGYAPKWVINTSSVIALIIASKQIIVTGLPIDVPELKSEILKWLDYVLEVMQVCLALAVIFISKKIQHDSE